MTPDLSYVTRKHLAIQRETCVGAYSPMRMCAGECKKRKSVAQFIGASTLCIRCARRSEIKEVE